MNTPAVALAALTLTAALAAAAQAAPQQGFATDVDYLRASRCRGIAEGVGADGAAISAYLKQQSLGRASYIIDRGQDERDHAKRQAKGGYAKPQLEAELASACAVYGAPASAVATHPAADRKG